MKEQIEEMRNEQIEKMATCNDCIHYGICTFHITGNENEKCPHYTPTADVVPKSEVERLTINMNAYGLAAKRLAEEKAEVASKIFAEIAEKLEGLFDFFRQDDCIRESCAIMLAISEIADLKKKYTEGEPNGQNIKK